MRGRSSGPPTRERLPCPRLLLGALLVLFAWLALPSAALAIDEFVIPTSPSQPSGITRGLDGALWFVEENSPPGQKHKIGRLDPAQAVPNTSSGFTEYLIPTSGATPSKIVTGPDGALWFTEQATHKIGRLDPALAAPNTSNGITEFPPSGSLPLPSSPDGITVGPDGALWFTQFSGNKIGRITTDGTITHYPLPSGNGNPTDIVRGPDNRLWFTEENPGRIGVIDPTLAVPGTSQGISEFDRPGTEPAGIAASGASLWFTQHLGNKVEQVSLNGVTLAQFPTGNGPSGITFGPDGALWLTELQGNRIGRLTTCGGYTAFLVPTSLSDPSDIVTGPDGALWFTEFSNTANRIGRIQAGSSSGCGGGAGGGGGGGAPPPPVSQSGKPSVQSLTVSPRAFRAAKAGASISAKVGAKVTYRLSVAASTKFTVERESAGRKKGKKCVKQTPRNRKAKRCKLYKLVRGSFSHRGKAGSNSFTFTGRVGRKSLKPGRYRLVAVATAGSARSTVKRASFRIVKR